ncbi:MULTISPECIES: caspase family protein [unclassified Caballeronia]|uniref:caspase family protein n=1 Tax=unclassified Caballeronia TaxID=2646786 RepID=UPI0020298853|nr:MULTISPECIES: caspase family protein [unclassified Caballeronia]
MRRVALLIGNDRFSPGSGLHDLRYPSRDVSELAPVLRDPSIGAYDRVELCVNGTKDEVLGKLASLLDEERGATALFYYSGHGKVSDSGRLFLATKDTRERLLSATAVAFSHVLEVKDDYGCSRFCAILDCCYAGLGSTDVKGSDADRIRSFVEGSGVYFLGATSASSVAKEDRELGHGILTAGMLEGFRTGLADVDHDGRITGSDLFAWCREYSANQGRQRPVQVSRLKSDEIAIAYSVQFLDPRVAVLVRERVFECLEEKCLPAELLRRLRTPLFTRDRLPLPLENTFEADFVRYAQGSLSIDKLIDRHTPPSPAPSYPSRTHPPREQAVPRGHEERSADAAPHAAEKRASSTGKIRSGSSESAEPEKTSKWSVIIALLFIGSIASCIALISQRKSSETAFPTATSDSRVTPPVAREQASHVEQTIPLAPAPPAEQGVAGSSASNELAQSERFHHPGNVILPDNLPEAIISPEVTRSSQSMLPEVVGRVGAREQIKRKILPYPGDLFRLPNERYALLCGWRTDTNKHNVTVVNLLDQVPVRDLVPVPTRCHSLQFLPNVGKLFVQGGAEDSMLWRIDTANGNVLTVPIFISDFSASFDGMTVAFRCALKSYHVKCQEKGGLIDMRSMRVYRRIDFDVVRFEKNGERYAYSISNILQIGHRMRGDIGPSIQFPGKIRVIQFSPDGQYLLVVDDASEQKRSRVSTWHIDTRKQISEVKVPNTTLRPISLPDFTDDSRYVTFADWTTDLKVYRFPSMKLFATLRAKSVTSSRGDEDWYERPIFADSGGWVFTNDNYWLFGWKLSR